MRALVLLGLVVLLVGLRCCPLKVGTAPRARLPRGYAAPQLLGGQPKLTTFVIVVDGVRL